MPLSTQQPE